ncbi:MAG: family 1 encapsulin nanocompartment shell protein [Candidatus Xenobia bacterium]
MSWLRRERAPLSDRVWQAIDQAAHDTARHFLAARHVADFVGPLGWENVAVRLGTSSACKLEGHAPTRASVCTPDVLLLKEVQASFSLDWSAVESFERGGPALDTDAVEAAAREVALAEDHLVFYGEGGLLKSGDSPSVLQGDWGTAEDVVKSVLSAVATLDEKGIAGPYALVLSPSLYWACQRAGAGGFPAARQLQAHVEKTVRSNALQGGALFSLRGGDYQLVVGGDLTVGYLGQNETKLDMFVLETVAAQLLNPQAVCLLKG